VSSCAEVRTALGVYVLGAIEPAERSRVEAHLSICPICRDELAGMAGLPALLGRVNEAQIDHVAGPPEELLDSLLTRAATERHTAFRFGRRFWVPLVAAAAALVAVAGFALGGLLGGGGTHEVAVSPTVSAPPSPEQVVAVDPRTHVRAVISLTREEWGTALALRIDGAPAGVKCRLYAVPMGGGSWDVAASWQVEEAGYGDYMGSTMLQRPDIKAFTVVTTDGRMLVTAPLKRD
jgi:anti-sigma factor RsiW